MAQTVINQDARLGFYNYFRQIQGEAVRAKGELSGVPPIDLSPYASVEEIADAIITLMRYCEGQNFNLAAEILRQLH